MLPKVAVYDLETLKSTFKLLNFNKHQLFLEVTVMKAPVGYEAPSWNQISQMLLKQVDKISKSSFKPDVIVGVSRGGWVPARILSDLLENSNLANVKVECYKGINEANKNATLTQCLSADVLGKRVLVVDEVADSGKSLNLVTQHVKEHGASQIKTATLYFKRDSLVMPDYFEKETECWVVFSWEIKETVKAIYSNHKNKPVQLKEEIAKLTATGIPKRLTNRFVKEFSRDMQC